MSYCTIITQTEENLYNDLKAKHSDLANNINILNAYINSWREDHNKVNLEIPTIDEIEQYSKGLLYIKSDNKGALDLAAKKIANDNKDPNQKSALLYLKLKQAFQHNNIKIVLCNQKELTNLACTDKYMVIPNINNSNITIKLNLEKKDIIDNLDEVNKALIDAYAKRALFNPAEDYYEKYFLINNNKIIDDSNDINNKDKDDLEYFNNFKQLCNKINKPISINTLKDLLINSNKYEDHIIKEVNTINDKYLEYLSKHSIPHNRIIDSINALKTVGNPTIADTVSYTNELWNYGQNDNEGMQHRKDCIHAVASLFVNTVQELANNNNISNTDIINKYTFNGINILVKNKIANKIQELQNTIKNNDPKSNQVIEARKQLYYNLLILKHFRCIIKDMLPNIRNISDINLLKQDKNSTITDFNTTEEEDTLQNKVEEVSTADLSLEVQAGEIAESMYTAEETQRNLDKLSGRVRQLIYNIDDVDVNNNVKKDILGNNKKLDGYMIHNYLQLYLSPKVINSNNFMQAFEEVAIAKPALYSLFTKVKEDTNLQILFFNVYNKDLVTYVKQNNGESIIINPEKNNNSVLQLKENIKNSLVLTKSSFYNADGTTNKTAILNIANDINSKYNETLINLFQSQLPRTRVDDIYELDSTIINNKEILNALSEALQSIGIDINSNKLFTIVSEHLKYLSLRNEKEKNNFIINDSEGKHSIFEYINTLVTSIKTNSNSKEINIEYYNNIIDSKYCNKYFTALANLLDRYETKSRELTASIAGATYNTCINNSFLGKLLKKINNDSSEDYSKLMNNFKKCSWFTNNGNFYPGSWLDTISKDPTIRKNLGKTQVLTYNDKENLHWTDSDYLESMINMFYGSINNMEDLSNCTKNGKNDWYYASFPIPLPSDSMKGIWINAFGYMPQSNTINNTIDLVIKNKLLPKLINVVYQEINRMNIVAEMNKNPNSPKIDNYNKRGLEFCFFPELNSTDFTYKNKNKTYTGKYLEIYKQLKDENLNADILVFTERCIKDIIEDISNSYIRFLEYKKEFYVDETGTVINKHNVKLSKNYDIAKEQIKLFAYNLAFSTSQIVQLTTTDLAYYKNMTDVFKRFKETVAPFRSYYSLGKNQRFIIIKDHIGLPLQEKDINEALNYAEKKGTLSKDMRSIIEHSYGKNQDGFNWTDAQSYRSIPSYKWLMIHSGAIKEGDATSKALDNLSAGKFDFKDFTLLAKVIKPFCYGVRFIPNGINNEGVEDNIAVPIQIKNSEVPLLLGRLLLSAYYNTGDKNSPLYEKACKLKAFEDFMEKNNLDAIHVESTIKVGGFNKVNIDTEVNKDLTTEGYNQTINKLNKALEDNPNIIHEISYEDAGISVPTPDEWKDADVNIGVQLVRELASNIADNTEITLGEKTYKGQEITKLFHDIFIDNLNIRSKALMEVLENPNKLYKELSKRLDSSGASQLTNLITKMVRNIDNGEYQPLLSYFDPYLGDNISKVLYSMIRNTITTQKTLGGIAYQMCAYGTGDDLNIRHLNNNKNLIFNEKEFNGIEECNSDYKMSLYQMKNKYKTYDNYIKSQDAKAVSLAYWEVAIPMYSKEFNSNKYLNKDGTIDISKIPNKLRKLLGCRIPTEDIHSIAPLYIKRALPSQMGPSILFPYDVTWITGSDFDIDKYFINRYAYNLKSYDASIKDESVLDEDLSSENLNNNKMLDVAWKILQHPNTYAKAMLPSNFETISKKSIIMEIINNINNINININYANNNDIETFTKQKEDLKKSIETILGKQITDNSLWEDLNNANDQQIEALANLNINNNSSPMSALTITNSHKAYSLGKTDLSIAATLNSGVRLLQNSKIQLRFPINIKNGNSEKTYKQLNKVSSIDYKGKPITITDIFSECLAASADMAKDPTLNKLNINGFTFSVFTTMILSGVDLETTLLFINQPIIKKLTDDYFNNDNKIVTSDIDQFKVQNSINFNLKALRTIDTDILRKNIIDNNNKLTTEKVAIAEIFLNLYQDGRELSDFIKMTKQDSRVAKNESSIIELFAKLFITKKYLNKVKSEDKFSEMNGEITEENFNKFTKLSHIDDLLSNDSNLTNISYPQAFYKAKLEAFESMSKYYPFFANKTFLNTLEQYLNNTRATSESSLVDYTKKFIKAYTIYNLSGLDIFNHDFRQEYINTFPTAFANFMQKAKDQHIQEVLNNDFFKTISYNRDSTTNTIKDLSIKNSIDINKNEINNMRLAWANALQSKSNYVKKIALQLFVYNYHKYGTDYFNKNSFNMFVPPTLLLNIPGYSEIEHNIQSTFTPEILNRFIGQLNNNIVKNKFDNAFIINLNTTKEEALPYFKYDINTNVLNISNDINTSKHTDSNKEIIKLITKADKNNATQIKYFMKIIEQSDYSYYKEIDIKNLEQYKGYDITNDLLSLNTLDYAKANQQEIASAVLTAYKEALGETLEKIKKSNYDIREDTQKLVSVVTENNKDIYCK